MTVQRKAQKRPNVGGRPSHHDNLRADLLRVGLEILRDEGPHTLTIRGLARRLNVSHGAPATYFPTREALLVALVIEAIKRLRVALTNSIDGTSSPQDQLRQLGTAYVRFGLEDRGSYAAIMLSGLPADAELTRIRAETFGITTRAVERVLQGRKPPQPNPEEVAAVLWSAVHGLCSLLIAGHIGSLLDETAQEQTVARLSEALLSRFP
jgi:AcrR family transcriptional regulator